MEQKIIGIDGSEAVFINTPTSLRIKGKDFNHFFAKKDGYSATWGKSIKDDPDYSPFGPLIADIEITTICSGPRNERGVRVPCSFCYKANTPNGTYMSFETFKKLFDKLPKTIGQIAFGVDAAAESNPDIWKIFEYCRKNWVVPNLTVADVSDEVADKIAKYAGACAVSVYDNKEVCYDTVKKLTDRGMTQVNLHWAYHSRNYTKITEIVEDIKNDPRLSKLNAIVFLALKQKGRGVGFTPLPFHKFKEMVEFVMESGISYGFDSCSCTNFLKAVKDHPNYEQFLMLSEPCESLAFSSYIDVNGNFYPCSFCENIPDWEEGISVINCEDFIKDIWASPRSLKFRENLLKCGRSCPVYKI